MKGTGCQFFMTLGYRNMAVVRLCLVFLLVLNVDRIAGKPFLGALFCDWYCDDDDDVSTTTSSSEDDYDLWGCSCRPRRRTTPSSIILPPIPGMSYNITNNRNRWIAYPVMATAASANSPVSQTTTVTRVSSVASTVPAGATTAAGGATQAAATTAASTTASTAAPAA